MLDLGLIALWRRRRLRSSSDYRALSRLTEAWSCPWWMLSSKNEHARAKRERRKSEFSRARPWKFEKSVVVKRDQEGERRLRKFFFPPPLNLRETLSVCSLSLSLPGSLFLNLVTLRLSPPPTQPLRHPATTHPRRRPSSRSPAAGPSPRAPRRGPLSTSSFDMTRRSRLLDVASALLRSHALPLSHYPSPSSRIPKQTKREKKRKREKSFYTRTTIRTEEEMKKKAIFNLAPSRSAASSRPPKRAQTPQPKRAWSALRTGSCRPRGPWIFCFFCFLGSFFWEGGQEEGEFFLPSRDKRLSPRFRRLASATTHSIHSLLSHLVSKGLVRAVEGACDMEKCVMNVDGK